MRPPKTRKPRRPLDQEALERLALHYVGRYATTRAKLRIYLKRKVQERGWEADQPADFDSLVGRIEALGYVDDAAFASARSASLQRRGYGERRIAQALKAAGIDDGDAGEAREDSQRNALVAALRFAERKRIGPYAAAVPDRAVKAKAFAAMARAGHPMQLIRTILDCAPGELPEVDTI